MRVITSILNFLFSTRLTGFLLILFAVAMATATFIENDFGTETSKALVYSAKWFEIVIVLLAINFVGNIAKYNLFSLEKAPMLLLHLAFIVIIIGAGVTKYRGYEALVTIKENNSTNQVLSIDSFLQLQAGNEKLTKNYAPKNLMMSKIGFNYINEDYSFEDKNINIKLKKYIHNAEYILVTNENDDSFLHLVISNNNQRKEIDLKKGTRQNLYGIKIAFDANNKLQDEIYIKSTDSTYLVSFPKETSYFSMEENKSGMYPEKEFVPLKFKALSQIDNTPIVFTAIEENKSQKLIQKEDDPTVKNPESAIILNLTSGKDQKEITLFGGKGYMNPSTTVFLNNLHLKMRYGSKPIQLPFKIGLKDFTLERYPGSDSPSAFYSDLQIKDEGKTKDYQIFMNNVLDYKGFRFFQSAYLPDESGTILSVNHDCWGTIITYIGYTLLAFGMALSLLWNTRLFNFITKQN